MPPRSRPYLSLVAPAFNEEKNIPPLVKDIRAALAPYSYEIIFVNDGSTDATAAILDKFSRSDKKIKVIHFRRNLGQTAAISAGIDHARGQLLALIDTDLQNNPADIPRMIKILKRERVDVVAGWRKHRQDPFFTRTLPSKIANALISKTTGVPLHDYGCTLKLFRAEILKPIHLYGEMHRFLPAYAAAGGAKIIEVPVSHHPRRFGHTKYGLLRTGKVLLDLLTVQFLDHFLTKPLYPFGVASFLCFLGGFFSLVYLIWIKLHGLSFIQSPILLLGSILSVLGVMFLALGLLAELIIRTYYESQNKKPYTILSTRNLSRRSTLGNLKSPK